MNTNKVLAKSAQSVQDALAKKGITCKVVELWYPVTAQDAAVAIGCDVGQIVKSLNFKQRNPPAGANINFGQMGLTKR